MPDTPKGIRISQNTSRLTIHWRRSAHAGHWAGEVIFFLIGLAFLVFPPAGLLPRIMQGNWAALKAGELVSIPFALLGLAVVYRTLTLLINTDTIDVTPQELKVRSGPFPPWDMETPTIPRREIAEMVCEVKVSRGQRLGHAGSTQFYDIYALTRSGKKRAVITGARESEPAYFVAHQIEKFLSKKPG